MASAEATLIRESTAAVPTTARPSPRFLLPRASGHRILPALPRLPPHDLVLDGEIQARFEGWADTTDLWRHWVAKLRPRHEPQWRELGILEGILASTYRVRRDSAGALLQLVPFWSTPTNTFVFPWGEATVTLEDMDALAGLPILGFPVLERRYYDRLQMEDERALAAVRAAHRCAGWAEHFLRQPEAGGARGERQQRLEHAAFLSLWLARFVLPAPSDPDYPDSGPDDIVPGEEVLHIAARLAHGHRAALAPAALASIYSDLSALHRHLIYWKQTDAPSVSAPMQILQLWVWERFPELRPATAATATGPFPTDGEDLPLPRAARWHDVHRALDPEYARAVFRAPKDFRWRPYGSSFWEERRRRGHGGPRAPLSSFARCLQPCELVGLDDIEQYNPHRVARQLGFVQDVPGTVTRLNSNLWEAAWETYTTGAEDYEFAIPSDLPGVTDEYAQWWKPYSVAYKGSGNNEGPSCSRNDTSGANWAIPTGCIVTGDIDNTDKVPSENSGSLNFSEKGNEDILVSTQVLGHPMEHSAGASREKSGNSERFSSGLLDGNTKLVSHEVCTKTLYYLSRFDRMKEAWDNDANTLPRRAVGTMEMIQKASAIRQAEMAELKKKINTLKVEIQALEAAQEGKAPE